MRRGWAEWQTSCCAPGARTRWCGKGARMPFAPRSAGWRHGSSSRAIVDEEPQGLRSLYVALTRATKRLALVHDRPLPVELSE